ncbi:MAG: DUF1573 domain-containing protein [Bacteroidales bacterium]|nr:DUF1573 domain-containing protein [Bacteroidales bacterium]
MKTLKHYLPLIALAVACVFYGNALQAQDSARIVFDKTVHDYGTIYQNDNGGCEFHFTNTGKVPLILTNVYSSCGCTVPSWPKEPIMPGKSNVIKVNYQTSRLGAINKTITVESNASNGSVRLSITGNVLVRPAKTLPEKEDNPMKVKNEEGETVQKTYPKPY